MTISKRSRDEAMKIIRDFHDSAPANHTIGPQYLTTHGLPKRVDAEKVVDVLRSMRYITYLREQDGEIYDIKLTDAGKCYFENKKDKSREKRAEWIRYIITTVIAIFALLIAAISLAAQLGLLQLQPP